MVYPKSTYRDDSVANIEKRQRERSTLNARVNRETGAECRFYGQFIEGLPL